MQKFWWPGYEMQLVGELQRQQNSSQFCDTLLQTEGISVPTHSCVLAALSPYLCQRLSSSPSPPSGQKRRLQLQTVTAQTLLKLVGLLYSGELEVRGSKEQNDVLAAAHQLGIGHLVLGYKDGWVKGGELLYRRQSVEKHMENGIHAEETRQRHRGLKMQDAQVQAEMNGKRENDPHAKKKSFVSVATQTIKSGDTSGFSSVLSDQTLEFPSSLATFSIPLQPQSIRPNEQLSLFSCPVIHSESTVGRSSVSETNTISSTLFSSLSDEPSSPGFQEANISKQLSETGDVTFALNVNNTRQEDRKANGQMTEDGGNAEQLREVCRDENISEEKRNSSEKRHGGGKSLENMKRMETTQTSVKMKLRRTTEEKAWKVVDKDETPFPLTSEKQGGSNLKTPQMDLTSALSVLPFQNPETPDLYSVIATSPKPSKHAGKSLESQSDVTPDHSRLLESQVLPQPQGSVEEPNGDIDRLLDEIMMGLNILPNLIDNCQRAQTSHDRGQNVCQVLENSPGSTHAGCHFYQNLRIQDGHSSADAAKFCGSVAEDTSMHPQTTGSLLPSTCVLREPKLQFPGLQPLSSQEDWSVLHFLPLSREDEPQPEQMFSLPCMNELRLPRPISPLGPRSPEAQQQPHPNKSFVNPENYVQQFFPNRSWFTEAPWSLHFPLHTLTEDKSNSLALRSNTGCSSEQLCVGWKPNKLNTCAETVGGVKERGTQPEEKSDPKKTKKKKRGATGDTAAPRKRRCKNVMQDSLGQYLDSKIPTFCSVSLSSNNVLAIERKMATNPSNKPCKLLEKTNEKATIKTSVEENTSMVGNLSTDQTAIRTRSFMKRSQEKKRDRILKKSVLIPVVCNTETKEKQGIVIPKRKRGRPRKIKLDLPPLHVGSEGWNCNEASEQQALPKLEATDRGKKRRRKVRKNTSEAEKAKSAKKAEENDDAEDPETCKSSVMVTLKEFQKFIKRQRKKSTESQETKESAGEEGKRDVPNGSNSEAQVEIKKSVKIQDPYKNQNYLLNSSAARCSKSYRDGTNSSTGQKKMSFEEDNLSSDDVLEVMEPSSDQQQLLKGALCWTGGSEAVQSLISDEAASHCYAKLPQATKKVLSQRTGPPSSGADGLSVTPGCDREEEDEEEVDVLVFSPVKGSPVGAREERMKSIVIVSCDEEEEEDVNEIDVTGDEEE